MESIILELSEEDDYGSWELWWRIAQNYPDSDEGELKKEFVQTIAQLVQEGRLKAKQRVKLSGQLQIVPLDTNVLVDEVERADKPNPDIFYWFGK